MSSQLVDIFLSVLSDGNQLEALSHFMQARFQSYRTIEPNRSRLMIGIDVSAGLVQYEANVAALLKEKPEEKDQGVGPTLNFDAVDLRDVPLHASVQPRQPPSSRPTAPSTPTPYKFHSYKPPKY